MDGRWIGLLAIGVEGVGPAGSGAAGVAVLTLCAVAGLGLWLFGGKALRLGFGALGAALGATGGWMASGALDAGIGPWAPIGVGLGVGAIVGLVALRFTVSASLALTLGLLAPLGVVAGHELAGRPMGAGEPVEQPLTGSALLLEDVPVSDDLSREALRALAEDRAEDVADRIGLGEGSDARRELVEHAERARVFAAELGKEFGSEWARLSPRDRAVLALSALTGLAVGFALGMWLPKRSGTIVASGAGVALWLPASALLAGEAGAPMGWTPHDPVVWLGVWSGLTVAGVGLQWIGWRRRADKG